MKTYKVYFEVNGKKIFMHVEAKSQSAAKQLVISRFIVFHKIEGPEDDYKGVDFLKDMFGIR